MYYTISFQTALYLLDELPDTLRLELPLEILRLELELELPLEMLRLELELELPLEILRLELELLETLRLELELLETLRLELELLLEALRLELELLLDTLRLEPELLDTLRLGLLVFDELDTLRLVADPVPVVLRDTLLEPAVPLVVLPDMLRLELVLLGRS